jgi:hypothetical protein
MACATMVAAQSKAIAVTNVTLIDGAFNLDVDYAMLQKIYGADPQNEKRYSPAKIVSCTTEVIQGNPDPKHISTSQVERLNWSVRTSCRRYTRLSNGFSRKLRNRAAAVSLNYFAYNFVRIHRTLRTSPARAAGVTDRLWDVSETVELLQRSESKKAA